MLLTKEVDYKVNTRSLKYYRNLGYNCKSNDIIKIKVEDLQLNSIPKVEYQCNKCKMIFKLSFKSFTHSHNINEIKILHSFYGYGAPLNKDVHKLFHDTYGYTETTYDDFLNFVKRIKNGEFTEWFDKNNLTININEDFVDYVYQIQGEAA